MFADASAQTEEYYCTDCFHRSQIEDPPSPEPIYEDDEYEPDSSELEDADESDIEYEDTIDVTNVPLSTNSDRFFLVQESLLLSLFSICLIQDCTEIATAIVLKTLGTMVNLCVTCKSGHKVYWQSQKIHNSLPIGNLLASASVLFSGSSISKVSILMHHLRVPFIGKRTFYRHQKFYLIPIINDEFHRRQRILIDERRGKEISVGGDARCDSPGHTAKYGSYTFMDVSSNKVLDIQLVQVRESLH